MATLETQYKNYQSENPDSTLTFEEWKKEFGKKIGDSFRKMFEKINTEEYKNEMIQKHKDYLESVSMDFQLGLYVGEYIVDHYLPTLSTDALQSRKVIKVSEEDTEENKRLDEEWFSTTRYQKNHSGEENGNHQKWEEYHKHNKMLEKKYLPKILECHLGLLRIDDELKFKAGISNTLWNCDMCSYDIEEKNIKIENDLEMGFTKISFQLSE